MQRIRDLSKTTGHIPVASCLSQTIHLVFEHARKYTIISDCIGLTSISHRPMVYFRHIKRLYNVDKSGDFPDGLEFTYQFLYFKGDKWIQVARIDNQLHGGKPGVHIHILKREKV